MADEELPTFKIFVTATEYREYTVVGNGEEDARVRLLTDPENYTYEVGLDVPDSIEVVDIWEA